MPILRLQSAMEYLMTYGWAILIIAVVLGAFVALGFFNGNGLAPKLPPGSCSVSRPDGPGSTAFINLQGVCNNGLPQYVANLGNIGYNDGNYIATGTNGLPSGNAARSIFAWVYFKGGITSNNAWVDGLGTYTTHEASALGVIGASGDVLYFGSGTGGSSDFLSSLVLPVNSWHFVGYVYSGVATNTVTIYLDNKQQSDNLASSLSTTYGVSCIGGRPSGGSCAIEEFPGDIADVQIYNTSFSSNDVTTLYDEGIGGAPIALPWLVGWWPLNGNGNDYSGNNNNANTISNVIFTTGWASGYSAP